TWPPTAFSVVSLNYRDDFGRISHLRVSCLSSSWTERRDTMDWATLYCPNRACSYYGRRFWRSLLVKNGSTRGQKQARCQACGRSVALTYGTAYFDLDADPALFDTVA